MGWIRYAAAAYYGALKAIMPTGAAWSEDPNSLLNQLLLALCQVPARIGGRAVDLLGEAIPSSTNELLPEWEQSTGLPDPCAGESPTQDLRRAQVVARLAATGGQSASYFQQVAKNLGYTVTITQFATARAGQTHAGQPCCGPAWNSAWQVNAPAFTIDRLQAGSTCGQPLASWGNTVLFCELERLSPAHTQPIFSYS